MDHSISSGNIPFEIPEIFSTIGWYLLAKPADFINFSRINSRIHECLCSGSAWRQLGFGAVPILNGKADPIAIAVILQNIEHKRLLEKSIRIRRQLDVQSMNYTKRNIWHTEAMTSMEDIRTSISSKLGLSRDLPYSFYEEYIANSVLPDHLVRSIAKMIEREPEYTLIPVIFNAFKLALTKTKEELLMESMKKVIEVSDYIDITKGTVRAGLMNYSCIYDPIEEKNLYEFLSDLFIICDATEKTNITKLKFNCFMKFIGDSKVVIFVGQYLNTAGPSTTAQPTNNVIKSFWHYWKVELATKSLIEYGAVHEHKMAQKVSGASIKDNYSHKRLGRVLKELLECDVSEIYEDLESFFIDCNIRGEFKWMLADKMFL